MLRKVPIILLMGWVCSSSSVAQTPEDPKHNSAPKAPETPETPPEAPETPPEDGRSEGPQGTDPENKADAPKSESAPVLLPPSILESPAPVYPAHRLKEALHPNVVVSVTLDASGALTEAQVEHGFDADFDAAALAAVRTWRFAPASKDGEPIAATVRVAVHFELPVFDMTVEPVHNVLTVPDPHVHVSEGIKHEHDVTPKSSNKKPPQEPESSFGAQTEVEMEMREEARGAADIQINNEMFSQSGAEEGAGILRQAPGVFISRPFGDAVAHRISLRGFDAEHGQDLAISVGGVPINLPSHIHGQGYADLGFLIGEAVSEMNVKEGVYDPSQGDFAVAGSIDLSLGLKKQHRGLTAKTSVGSFRTVRQLLMWAPKSQRTGDTLGAVSLRRSDGFGEQRASRSASGIVQAGFRHKRAKFRVLGIVYGNKGDSAGAIRRDDIQSGAVDFYGSYDTPTARGQGATSMRGIVGLSMRLPLKSGANTELGLWFSHDSFRIKQNLTGFSHRSLALNEVAGLGDLIEQRNQSTGFGWRGRYRTKSYTYKTLDFRAEAGLSGRFDTTEQQQTLIDAANRNQTWDERVDASVQSLDVGIFGDLNLTIAERVTLRFGMRGDLLSYDVNDRLGNRVTSFRDDDRFIVGFRRSSAGVVFGPRASAEVLITKSLRAQLAYGEGFRSPQARVLEEGESTPFTKVRSMDLGVRYELGEKVQLNGSLFWSHLSDDIAFDPREGRLERIGASRRMGASLYLNVNPCDWASGALSMTFVDAELLEPPVATADMPRPAFEKGQNLPYVPPFVLRADVKGHTPLVKSLRGAPLEVHYGSGFSYISPRPLPFGEFSEGVPLLDLSVGLRYRSVDLRFDVFNLVGTQYGAAEFNYASNWQPSSVPSRLPARHTAAGAPRSFMFSISGRL